MQVSHELALLETFPGIDCVCLVTGPMSADHLQQQAIGGSFACSWMGHNIRGPGLLPTDRWNHCF